MAEGVASEVRESTNIGESIGSFLSDCLWSFCTNIFNFKDKSKILIKKVAKDDITLFKISCYSSMQSLL